MKRNFHVKNQGLKLILFLVFLFSISHLCVCMLRNLKKKNEYSFWIDMFDEKQMINLYHNTLFIKTITEKQTAVFNFGRGNYSYKNQNFSPKIEQLFSINIFRNNYSLKFYQLTNKVY